MNMPQTLELVKKEIKEDKKERKQNKTDGNIASWIRQHSPATQRDSTHILPDSSSSEGDADTELDEDMAQEKNDNTIPWTKKLSSHEEAKIHLARALVMNPEVLVLHRPTLNYDHGTALKIMMFIRKNVDNRGFKVPEETRGRRRPRTCFYTPTGENEEGIREADILWNVTEEGHVYVKDKHEYPERPRGNSRARG